MAWIRHASRADMSFGVFLKGHISGGRVSNTWVTYPEVRDNPGKLGLIPDSLSGQMPSRVKGVSPPQEGPAAHQVVGGVMAHQADDG